MNNDFVITVATVNGSGSQSSNNILLRSLFRLGIPVGGKNLFPSNIQGLPTWFTIRANEQGFVARRKLADIVVCMNPSTVSQDFKLVRPGGFLFLNSEIKLPIETVPKDVQLVSVPFKDIVADLSDSIKLKKLLVNMAYVGVLSELLEIPEAILDDVIAQQFDGKESVVVVNRAAISAGRKYAAEHLKNLEFPFRVKDLPGKNKNKILIDGNTSAAMGLVFGGCTVVAWYPITPSSSLVESFSELADKYRVDAKGNKNYAVVQAEDELASIAMVLGAGWAGARAMTATSGPGLSLMSEAAGLSYYAEIPAVIWDVQRVGPSTGLPTRTMQGDLLTAYYLSHGDTKHVVLLPGTVGECFEFGQTAFDLAERLQTLVLVLSDLDLGMNLHVHERFAQPTKAMDRGKVLTAEQLTQAGSFQRYKDVDGDGIPHRTLTGTEHPLAGYFTRGTGHDEAGLYTESPEAYKANMQRLSRKFATAAAMVPKPLVEINKAAKVGLVIYGATGEATGEARAFLKKKGLETNTLRLRALPFSQEVDDFLRANERIYVIEQNRDAQLMTLLRAELPQHWEKCHSVLQFDGMPIDAEEIVEQILQHEAELK